MYLYFFTYLYFWHTHTSYRVYYLIILHTHIVSILCLYTDNMLIYTIYILLTIFYESYIQRIN